MNLLVVTFACLYWYAPLTSAIVCRPYEKYALPNNCTWFATCDADRNILTLPCPPGLHFNIRRSACDWPHVANCTREVKGNGRNITAVRAGYVRVIALRRRTDDKVRNTSVSTQSEKLGNKTATVEVKRVHLYQIKDLRNGTVKESVNLYRGKTSFNTTKKINASVGKTSFNTTKKINASVGKTSFNTTKKINASVVLINGKSLDSKDKLSSNNKNQTVVKAITEEKKVAAGQPIVPKPVVGGKVKRSISIRQVKAESKQAENNTKSEKTDEEKDVKDKKALTSSEKVNEVKSNVTEQKNLALVKEMNLKEKLSEILNSSFINLTMDVTNTDLGEENKTVLKESNVEKLGDVEFVPVILNSTSKQNIFGYKIVDTVNSTIENLTKSEMLSSGGNVSRSNSSLKTMNSTTNKEVIAVKNITLNKVESKSKNVTKASSKSENVTNKETSKEKNKNVTKTTHKHEGKTKDKDTLNENKNETAVENTTKNKNSTISKSIQKSENIEISKAVLNSTSKVAIK